MLLCIFRFELSEIYSALTLAVNVTCFEFVMFLLCGLGDELIAVFIHGGAGITLTIYSLACFRTIQSDYFLISQSKHLHLPSALPSSSCIFTVKRGTNYSGAHRISSSPSLCFTFCYFYMESKHFFLNPKLQCQDSLRPSSCESYSVTIIVHLLRAVDLHVFGREVKIVTICKVHLAQNIMKNTFIVYFAKCAPQIEFLNFSPCFVVVT